MFNHRQRRVFRDIEIIVTAASLAHEIAQVTVSLRMSGPSLEFLCYYERTISFSPLKLQLESQC